MSSILCASTGGWRPSDGRRLALSVAAALLAGVPIMAAEPPSGPFPGKVPWTETFTMNLRDKEHTFVVYKGGSYLLAKREDIADPAFIAQKDAVLIGKIERIEGVRIRLMNLPRVEVQGSAELWRTRLDGENCHFFGHLSNQADGRLLFTVHAVESAPSDAQILASRLAGIPETDWAQRLEVAKWARETAAVEQGNKEYWLAESDNIITEVIGAAAAQAETTKDIALIEQAIDWSIALLKDRGRAARIASAPWIRAQGGLAAEDLAKRMTRLDMAFYKDQWRPRPEALALEYEDRSAALAWKDAEGFYRLGRWADTNADFLPRAKDLIHRAYQAGLRADPDHAGIRRELGLAPVGTAVASGAVAGLGARFASREYGIVITPPPTWKTTRAIDGGEATWIDPGSDTAYITARIVTMPEGTDAITVWTSQIAQCQTRTGYALHGEDALTVPAGEARRLHYTWTEGRNPRNATMAMVLPGGHFAAVRFDANYVDDERAAVQGALDTFLAQVSVDASTGASAGQAAQAPAESAPPLEP